jgi:hypothetical protein
MGLVYTPEEDMGREALQQPLQGGGECSLGQTVVMIAAQPARGLVVEPAEECQPEATEFEIRGVAAMACVRGTTARRSETGDRRCVRNGLPLPEAGRLQGGLGTGVRG